MRPPLWMSTITSEIGKSSVERKWASCSSAGPVGEPGNERFRFAPEGQRRVYAREASGEAHGITITRPVTCSGCSVLARLSAAIWPSGSSPCTPPITSTVGPAPFPTETIGIQRLDQPAVFDERGTLQHPDLLPVRRRVDRAGNRRVAHGPQATLVDC